MQRILRPEVRIAASAALLQRGCVNVIGLEEIKAKAGPNWLRMRESVCVRMERLLAQKLGPADFFIQLDETSFLVSMPAATEEEAQVFCIRVAHELHTTLLGHCDVDRLQLARPLQLEGDNLALTLLSSGDLGVLAGRAGLRSRAKAANSETKQHRQPEPKSSIDADACRFVPMWSPQKEAIAAYSCRAAEHLPTFEYVVLDARFRTDLGTMLNRVRCAASAVGQHLRSGAPFLMSIPIPYLLLSIPAARMELTGLCRGLSAELRPFLAFEIDDVPHGVPQSRISDLVGSFKPFCRGISMNVQFRNRVLGIFQILRFFRTEPSHGEIAATARRYRSQALHRRIVRRIKANTSTEHSVGCFKSQGFELRARARNKFRFWAADWKASRRTGTRSTRVVSGHCANADGRKGAHVR